MAVIENIRELFDSYFDRGWLAMSLEGTPLQLNTLREIRQLLDRLHTFPDDHGSRRYAVKLLQQFALELRRYLLPCIREKLGVSGFVGTQQEMDERQQTYRRLLAYTFSFNLERLEELTDLLEAGNRHN